MFPAILPLLTIVWLGIICDEPLLIKPLMFELSGTVAAVQMKVVFVLFEAKEIGWVV